MSYHLRCPHCTVLLYCRSCDEAIDSDASIPGAVGKRHTAVPFDPDRRRAWERERGRILLAMADAHPHKFLLARELWALTSNRGSPNQTCTRLGELASQGLVRRTGVERETETGAPADEWMLTGMGLTMVSHKVPHIDPPPKPPRFRRLRKKT